jgi:hypothetical protein
MKNDVPLPPIIADMISKLNSPTTPDWNKDNLMMTLDGIVKACDKATQKYREQKQKAEAAQTENKTRRKVRVFRS